MGRFCIEGLHATRYQVDVDAPGFVRHVVQSVELARASLRDDAGWTVLGALSNGCWNNDWDTTFGARPEVQALLPHLRVDVPTVLDVRLERALAIEGTVAAVGGDAIAGAVIRIERHEIESREGGGYCSYSLTPSREVTSGLDGRFVLWTYPKGKVALRVTAPGHVFHTREVDLRDAAGPLRVELQPGAALSGRVRRADGGPADEATVAAFVPKDDGRCFQTLTAPDGRFELDGVEPGELAVIAWEADYGACVATASAGETLDLTLAPPAYLRGRIVDASGRPLARAMVYHDILWRMNGRVVQLDGSGFESAGLRARAGAPSVLRPGVFLPRRLRGTDSDGRFEVETYLDWDGDAFVKFVTIQVNDQGCCVGSDEMACRLKPGVFHELVFRPAPMGVVLADLLIPGPATSEHFEHRGDLRLDGGGVREAIADYVEALRARPRDARLWVKLGAAYERAARRDVGRLARGSSEGAQAAGTSPHPDSSADDFRAAIAAFTSAIEIDPNPETLMARAAARHEAGDHDGAIADCTVLLQGTPQDADVWRRRGIVHLARGDVARALADLDRAIEIEPGNVWSWVQRSEACEAGGDRARARRDAERAVELASAVEDTGAGLYARLQLERLGGASGAGA